MLDSEKVANDGKQNDLYLLNSNRPKRVTWRCFDIPFHKGEDIRLLPFIERQRRLIQALTEAQDGDLLPAESLGNASSLEEVLAFKKAAIDRGFEGIVVKGTRSVYENNAWLKMKKVQSGDWVITGVKQTKEWVAHGIAETFLVSRYDQEQNAFKPVGAVSSGLSKKVKAELGEQLRNGLLIPISPSMGKWEFLPVEPKIVVEVAYTGVIKHALREPRLLRVRTDKAPLNCTSNPFFLVSKAFSVWYASF